MKIYNFLFYHGYRISKNSGNFDDFPVLGGIQYVIVFFILNIATISFVLDGFGLLEFILQPASKYIFSGILIIMLLFYYSYKSRYLQIINEYENKNNKNSLTYSVCILILYLVFSFALLLIAGLFKNKDWIFAN